MGIHKSYLVCSSNRVQVVLNRNGRKDGGQQQRTTRSTLIKIV